MSGKLEFDERMLEATFDDVFQWHHAALGGDPIAIGTLTALALETVQLRPEVDALQTQVGRSRSNNRSTLVLFHTMRVARRDLKKYGRIRRRELASAVTRELELAGKSMDVSNVRRYLQQSPFPTVLDHLESKTK
jgi:hypothetical protein